MISRKLWSTLALLCLVVVASARADTAPEPKGITSDDGKWLLSDAEFFVKINIKQMMASDLMTKRGITALKDAIKNNEQLKTVLEAAELDITKDVDSIMASGSGKSAKDAKALVVIRGKFNQVKMQDALEKAAKNDDKLKIVKEGTTTLYEIQSGDSNMYAAFVNKNTMVLTQNKESTVAAVKDGGKKTAVLSKEMKAALGKFTGKESMSMALVVNDELKQMLAKVPNVSGASKVSILTTSVTLSDAVALEIAGITGEADSAKKLSKDIGKLKALGAVLLADNEAIPPIATEMLEAIKINSNKEAVLLELKVTKEMIEKATKGGGKDK